MCIFLNTCDYYSVFFFIQRITQERDFREEERDQAQRQRHDLQEYEISHHNREMEKMEMMLKVEELRSRRGPSAPEGYHCPPSTPATAAFTLSRGGGDDIVDLTLRRDTAGRCLKSKICIKILSFLAKRYLKKKA